MAFGTNSALRTSNTLEVGKAFRFCGTFCPVGIFRAFGTGGTFGAGPVPGT